MMITCNDKSLMAGIFPVGQMFNNTIFMWTWNDKAQSLGLGTAPSMGVIAQDVREKYPEAVQMNEKGYLTVDNELLHKLSLQEYAKHLEAIAKKKAYELDYHQRLIQELVDSGCDEEEVIKAINKVKGVNDVLRYV